MRYCRNCGTNITHRGNRASKCKSCQSEDSILIAKQEIVVKLGSPNPYKIFKGKGIFNSRETKQHTLAILPEDNSDDRQNAALLRVKRSREEVYKVWKKGYI